MTEKNMSKMIVALVKRGASWNDLKKFFKKDDKNIKKMFYDVNHYDSEEKYNKLWKRIDENTKRERVHKNACILVETGALMSKNSYNRIRASKDIEFFVPSFCVRELQKLQESDYLAVNALNLIREKDIREVTCESETKLIKRPDHTVAPRVYGIVDYAMHLREEGINVGIWTNSFSVAKLAKDNNVHVVKFSTNNKTEVYM